MHWQHRLSEISARIIRKPHMPQACKELAWRVLLFVTKCRQSNPLSFALRPIFTHRYLHLGVGAVIIASVIGLASWSGTNTVVASPNTGGAEVTNLIPESDVHVTTTASVRVPINYIYMSQGFWALHPGIDLASHIGEPIYPVMDGVVTQVLHDKWDYGNHVIITHANKMSSLYAHMLKTEVTVGQVVTTNTEIGQVGVTGRTTGPHLHLEIHDENDQPFNPAPLLGIQQSN